MDPKVLKTAPSVDAAAIAKRKQPAPETAPEGEFLAVTQSDAVHFHTGSLTRQCAWPQYAAPGPVAVLNADDAAALGIDDGDAVKLTSADGDGIATASLAKTQAAGVVAVSSGFADMRGLFPWNETGTTGPVTVKIEKAGRET